MLLAISVFPYLGLEESFFINTDFMIHISYKISYYRW